MVLNCLFAQMGTMRYDMSTGKLNPKTFKPDQLVCSGGGSHPYRRELLSNEGDVCSDIATFSALQSTLLAYFVGNPVMRLGKELKIKVLHPQGVTVVGSDKDWIAVIQEYKGWDDLEEYMTGGLPWKGLHLLCDPVLSRSGVNKDSQGGTGKIKAASVGGGSNTDTTSSTVALVVTTTQAANDGLTYVANLFRRPVGAAVSKRNGEGHGTTEEEKGKKNSEKHDDDGDEMNTTDERKEDGTQSAEGKFTANVTAWMVRKMMTTQTALLGLSNNVAGYFVTASGKRLNMEDEPALKAALYEDHKAMIADHVKELQGNKQAQKDGKSSAAGGGGGKRRKVISLLEKEGERAHDQWLKNRVRISCGGCNPSCAKPSWALGWGYVPVGFTRHIDSAAATSSNWIGQPTLHDLFTKRLLNGTVMAGCKRTERTSPAQQTGDGSSEASKAKPSSTDTDTPKMDGTKEEVVVVQDEDSVSEHNISDGRLLRL
jgi:hypothetical protein